MCGKITCNYMLMKEKKGAYVLTNETIERRGRLYGMRTSDPFTYTFGRLDVLDK